MKDLRVSVGPRPSFEGLPPMIREQIYAQAGLIRVCPIDIAGEFKRLSHWKATMKWWSQPDGNRFIGLRDLLNYNCPYRQKLFFNSIFEGEMKIDRGAECICPPLPIQLLQVSSSIGYEAFKILYSRNKFKLELSTLDQLYLNPAMYSRLHSLQISLTRCSCVTNHYCQDLNYFIDGDQFNTCHTACKRGPGAPLAVQTDKALLAQWRAWIKILQSNCSVNLRLTLICDCKNLQTALQVVSPLRGLPKITSCSIRLGQSPNDQLRQLAESKAQELTRTRPDYTSFALERLPEEIQDIVLSYTDLVSPTYLAWNEWDRNKQPVKSLRQFGNYGLICCMQCNDIGEVCTCPVRHAAATVSAFTKNVCKCWHFPSSIFLVNKHINRIATRIFFSKNKFIIWNTTPYEEGERSLEQQVKFLADPNSILRSLSIAAFSHLRWVRLNFRSFHQLDGQSNSPGYKSWTELTSRLKYAVPDLSLLTIELDLWSYLSLSYFFPEGDRHDIAKKWTAYQNIAELFKVPPDTRNYRDFFIYLGSPQPNSARDDVIRWRRERELEARIMGDGYNAGARGKYRKRGVGFTTWLYQGLKPYYGPDGEVLNDPWRAGNSYELDEELRPRRFERAMQTEIGIEVPPEEIDALLLDGDTFLD